MAVNQAEADKEIRSQLVSTLESGHNHMALAEATKAFPTSAINSRLPRVSDPRSLRDGAQQCGQAYLLSVLSSPRPPQFLPHRGIGDRTPGGRTVAERQKGLGEISAPLLLGGVR